MTNIEAASRIWAILERTQMPDYMCIDRQSLADREALNLAIEALKAQSDKDNNVLSKTDGDCISRKWCLAEYDRQHVGPPGGARKIIAEAPSIVPERKPGHWIDVGAGMTMWPVKCSVCGIRQSADSKYCPDCGARMLKEGES